MSRSIKPHWSFWLISTLLLVWNLLGCVNFFMQMNPAVLELYRGSERLIVEDRPVWATAGFVVAVFGGAFGCLLLLFRQFVAVYAFILSLLGVVVTMAHSLSLGISFGIGEFLGIILMPLLVAGFLIWYSFYSRNKFWIS